MKKLAVLLTAFTLICSFFVADTEAYAKSKFKDVTTSHWATKEVEFLTGRSVIQGYPDGSFKPNSYLTRVQIARMIQREKKYSLADRSDPQLKDVTTENEDFPIISAVMSEGIFKDVVKNNEFKPNASVTRAEMASILAKAYNLTGTSTTQFKDVAKTSWAYPSIQAVAKNQITTGYDDGTFKPNAFLTRAQFSAFMTRTLDKSYRVSPNKPTGKVYPDGWIAPVLKSAWSPNQATNFATLQNELGFHEGGHFYGIRGKERNIIVNSDSGENEVTFKFYSWTNRNLPESYRIPIVAKELFKLYFGADAERVWNYNNNNDIPEQFTANGRTVKVSYIKADGSIYFEVGKKK